MDINEMLHYLVSMNKKIQLSDPLLKRGIEIDWVVVVSPAIINNLEYFFNRHYKNIAWYENVQTQDEKAQVVLGRKMYIDNRCGIHPEYMAQEEYERRYPELTLMIDESASTQSGDDESEGAE